VIGFSREQFQLQNRSAISIRRTKLRRERFTTTLKRTRLSPTITTSLLGAQRLFSSLLPTFQRSAARTATNNQSLLSCTVFLTTTRSYAKKKKMPPKKAAKEEKILLGRPGNNLKSGIVCCSAVDLYEMLTIFRSALPTLASLLSFKLSPNVTLETLP
jgi:hypothetical protein